MHASVQALAMPVCPEATTGILFDTCVQFSVMVSDFKPALHFTAYQSLSGYLITLMAGFYGAHSQQARAGLLKVRFYLHYTQAHKHYTISNFYQNHSFTAIPGMKHLTRCGY